MENWKNILCIAAGLSLLGLVTLLVFLPRRRTRQLGQLLRQIIEDPEQPLALPRSLSNAGGELSRLREELLRQQQTVQEQKRRQQDLIAFLAHDLKTPLTSVLGYLELLQYEPELSREQREHYLGITLEKARRLEELVGEFFDINTMALSVEHGETIQLSFLLEQLMVEFYPLLSEKDLQGLAQIQPHLTVRGDAEKLARVFDNVLRNAVSYSTPGTAVELTARLENGQVVAAVSNMGLEIPEGELSHIFEKFYRLDAARSSRTGGAGLCLAIAREIVEAHGGTIRAECTGCKTTFTITLPAANE